MALPPVGGAALPAYIMQHQPQWVDLAPGATQVIQVAGNVCNVTNDFNVTVQVDINCRFLPAGKILFSIQLGGDLMFLPIRDDDGHFFQHYSVVLDADNPNAFGVI